MDSQARKKMGQKGIPHSKQIQFEQFLDALYENKQFSCETHSLMTKVGARARAHSHHPFKKRKMSRVRVEKKILNSNFFKFGLEDNAISCTPLKFNDKIL